MQTDSVGQRKHQHQAPFRPGRHPHPLVSQPSYPLSYCTGAGRGAGQDAQHTDPRSEGPASGGQGVTRSMTSHGTRCGPRLSALPTGTDCFHQPQDSHSRHEDTNSPFRGQNHGSRLNTCHVREPTRATSRIMQVMGQREGTSATAPRGLEQECVNSPPPSPPHRDQGKGLPNKGHRETTEGPCRTRGEHGRSEETMEGPWRIRGVHGGVTEDQRAHGGAMEDQSTAPGARG